MHHLQAPLIYTATTGLFAFTHNDFAQVPIIEDHGKVVNDSFDIALYLERTYPDKPTLFGGPGGAALLLLHCVLGYVAQGQYTTAHLTVSWPVWCACRVCRGLQR